MIRLRASYSRFHRGYHSGYFRFASRPCLQSRQLWSVILYCPDRKRDAQADVSTEILCILAHAAYSGSLRHRRFKRIPSSRNTHVRPSYNQLRELCFRLSKTTTAPPGVLVHSTFTTPMFFKFRPNRGYSFRCYSYLFGTVATLLLDAPSISVRFIHRSYNCCVCSRSSRCDSVKLS